MRRVSRLAPLWVALGSLLISSTLATFTPLPAPRFHDEFSYLLAGDTLARGRVTNRPHELGEFFESFQILQQPTYTSKYPPGQGLVLALGQATTGLPIVGVWISTAVAVAAAWWALAGFAPKRWAMLGAVIAATHPLLLQWNWSFWGGAVAVIGGALAIGGIARWQRASDPPLAGLAIGAGLFILLISRPFEGTVLVILAALLLRARSFPPARGGRGRTALIAFTVLLIGVAWIGYYNWRVTDSARLPYLVYENTYAICPPFLWMPRTSEAPAYRHESMRRYYTEWELPQYLEQRHQPMRMKLWDFARAYFWSPALLLGVVMSVVCMRRDRLVAGAVVAGALFTMIIFGNLWFFPHYAAPGAALYLLLVVQGLRRLRAIRGGRWFVRGVLLLHLIATIAWVARLDRSPQEDWNHIRAGMIEQARAERRRLLVIVRPGPDHYTHNEWVYNDADIDASPIVWARDRGDDRNQGLLEYFKDREVLLLTIDAQKMQFDTYGP